MERNINAFQQLFDLNDPEVISLLNQIDALYSQLMGIVLKKRYGVEAHVLDETHIEIDGVVMDDNAFGQWLFEKQLQEEEADLNNDDINWEKA